MADYWARRSKIFEGLRGLPPQAKGLARALASRANTIAPEPTDMALVLYPTYVHSRSGSTGVPVFGSIVRGWLYKEGNAQSRRARLIISTAEKLVGGADHEAEAVMPDEQLIDLFDADEETLRPRPGAPSPGASPERSREGGPPPLPSRSTTAASFASADSRASRGSTTSAASCASRDSEASSLLTARALLMFRKGISDQDIELEVWPDKAAQARGISPKHFWVATDESGRFEHELLLPFKPSRIVARYDVEFGGPVADVEPEFVTPEGITIISDIDDTVRLTGINKGRRETLRNVLTAPYDAVRLEGVDDWYRRMQRAGAAFHFVSNSPWQLFDLVHGYLDELKFPPGSIHLKYYQGIFEGLFEPVVSRKKATLERILQDFPKRKFILIGDSGELDLEAYTLLAQRFPDQVLAIFIRDITLPESVSLDVLYYENSNGNLDTQSVSDAASIRSDEGDHMVPPAIDLIDLTDDVTDSASTDGTTGSADNAGKKKAPPIPPRPAHLRRRSSPGGGDEYREHRDHLDHVPKNPGYESTPEWKKLHKAVLTAQREGASGGVGGSVFSATSLASAGGAKAASAVQAAQRWMSKQASEQGQRPGWASAQAGVQAAVNAATQAAASAGKPPLPPRRQPPPDFVTSAQDYSEYASSGDKLAEAWKTRVSIARRSLPRNVTLKMWRTPQDVEVEALRLLQPDQKSDLL